MWIKFNFKGLEYKKENKEVSIGNLNINTELTVKEILELDKLGKEDKNENKI